MGRVRKEHPRRSGQQMYRKFQEASVCLVLDPQVIRQGEGRLLTNQFACYHIPRGQCIRYHTSHLSIPGGESEEIRRSALLHRLTLSPESNMCPHLSSKVSPPPPPRPTQRL